MCLTPPSVCLFSDRSVANNVWCVSVKDGSEPTPVHEPRGAGCFSACCAFCFLTWVRNVSHAVKCMVAGQEPGRCGFLVRSGVERSHRSRTSLLLFCVLVHPSLLSKSRATREQGSNKRRRVVSKAHEVSTWISSCSTSHGESRQDHIFKPRLAL